jgi:hypothetical protein
MRDVLASAGQKSMFINVFVGWSRPAGVGLPVDANDKSKWLTSSDLG